MKIKLLRLLIASLAGGLGMWVVAGLWHMIEQGIGGIIIAFISGKDANLIYKR